MPKSRLVTPSLISSIKWFENCPNSWREKAKNDLTNTLSRIWKEPSPEIKRGIEMENKVYDIAKTGVEVNCSPEFQFLLDACKGGQIQKKGKTFIEHNGHNYCIYGKYDIWFSNLIRDIKTTKNFSQSKYRESAQHILYCFIEQIPDFEYIVAVMSEVVTDMKIQRIEEIKITVDLDMCKDVVLDYLKYIEQFFANYPSFEEMYLEKYCLY